MPVLPKETSIWPENLFETHGSQDSDQNIWWALHTRPRTEKSLARRLLTQGISYFLPLREKRRRLQSRWVMSHLPIFPGYLFLRGSEEDRFAALKTNYILNCLEVTDQDRLTADLSCIHRLVESGLPLSPVEQLLPGSEAEITSGPLAGLQGIVIRNGTSTKLILKVHLLQQGVSVEVENTMVQPIWHG